MKTSAWVLALLLLAGCVGAPEPDVEPTPLSPTSATPPAGDVPCGRVGVLPERDEVPGFQRTVVEVVFVNCGTVPVTLTAESPCDRIPRTTLTREGEAWTLLAGDAAWARPPDPSPCEEPRPSLTVEPGGLATRKVTWNGTVLPGGCRLCDDQRPSLAPPGVYHLVARFQDVDGRTWEGHANLTLAPPRLPPAGPEGDVLLLMNATYRVGERAQVQARNVGNRTYQYNPFYQACEFTYYDDAGRTFRIPPGTHCDLIGWEPIAPGETVTLFNWSLDECVVDRWGCAEAAPLPPGTYHVRGELYAGEPYRERRLDEAAAVAATFRIVAE